MGTDKKVVFFDNLADKWDSFEDPAILSRKLTKGLEEFGVGASEKVLDVGCGTGNLTQALLARLSPEGRVTAVDLSKEMVAIAKRKISDTRVEWHTVDAMNLPLPDASVDRVICYSVWPHFDDHEAISKEFHRVLRIGGHLHIWHLASREKINQIHASAGEAVCRDILAPADETAKILVVSGYQVTIEIEDSERYLVSAVKVENN